MSAPHSPPPSAGFGGSRSTPPDADASGAGDRAASEYDDADRRAGAGRGDDRDAGAWSEEAWDAVRDPGDLGDPDSLGDPVLRLNTRADGLHALPGALPGAGFLDVSHADDRSSGFAGASPGVSPTIASPLSATGAFESALGARLGPARRLDGGYELRVRAGGDGVSAHVVSVRPADALRLAEGRPVGEAVGLAAAIFPMSAAAQTAAALSAAEAALKITIAPAHAAARQLMVGFEAAAACAWRMGLVWPQLSGGSAPAEAVQTVRAAADAAAGLLFADGDWARLGGGAPRPDMAGLLERIGAVRTALRALAPTLDAVTADAPGLPGFDGRSWPLLDENGVERAAFALAGDPGFAVRPHLSGRVIEESPRALLQMWRAEEGLAAWFSAQAQFALRLPDRLEAALKSAAPADTRPAAAKGSGRGWGMAATARGRIIHWMSVDRGLVSAWRAIEPSDWNFSPKGPVARAMELFPSDEDLADCGRWVVAAFDPSAPCRVMVETADGVGHA